MAQSDKQEAPERIWIDPNDQSFWNDNSDVRGLTEYARVTRFYFCSCGGALTAEEYIIHYFEKGHDRGDPAFSPTARVTSVVATEGRSLYSELIKIAAELVRADGFLSPYDDMPTRHGLPRIAAAQEAKLKDWAYRVRQVANKLSYCRSR